MDRLVSIGSGVSVVFRKTGLRVSDALLKEYFKGQPSSETRWLIAFSEFYSSESILDLIEKMPFEIDVEDYFMMDETGGFIPDWCAVYLGVWDRYNERSDRSSVKLCQNNSLVLYKAGVGEGNLRLIMNDVRLRDPFSENENLVVWCMGESSFADAEVALSEYDLEYFEHYFDYNRNGGQVLPVCQIRLDIEQAV